MNKIVALCSGGFDSIVMLHYIKNAITDCEVHTLFFDYGQKTVKQEEKCASKASKELGFTFHKITLPKFSWSVSSFYSPEFSGVEGECLEMRNMIFLSFALSLCQSIKAEYLYMAVLKSAGYYDTSSSFLEKISSISTDVGVHFVTPFSDTDKWGLASLAFTYGISESDFFSCDNPVNDLPCGVCPDCRTLSAIYDEVVNVSTPYQAWSKTFNPNDESFQKLIISSPIEEIRLLINNECQLKCPHCYYGFDSMKESRMSIEEFKSVFEQAKELGIHNYHYSGKEPLYDDFIFKVVSLMREVDDKSFYTVVTNGINVPKYASKLRETGCEKVFLSIDDVLKDKSSMHQTCCADKSIQALQDVGIPIEIFIDVSVCNYNKVVNVIEYLRDRYELNTYFVRVIVPVGNATDIPEMTLKQISEVAESIDFYTQTHQEIEVTLVLPIRYTYKALNSFEDLPICEAVRVITSTANSAVSSNFYLIPEMYCGKYENQITITPDGYVHGCASEVSSKDYDVLSVGNVKRELLSSLIAKGKLNCLSCNKKQVNKDGYVYFSNCTCKLLD